MLDKNGKEIKVGDLLRFVYPDTLNVTQGKVVEVDEDSIRAVFEDTNRSEYVRTSARVEIISRNDTPSFNDEDEKKLQELLERKRLYNEHKMRLELNLNTVCDTLCSKNYYDLREFLKYKAQAALVVETLKEYHDL